MRNTILITLLFISFATLKGNAQFGYESPKGMVPGGQFMDRILPFKPLGPLRSDVWGAKSIIPRDVLNGLEDNTYSYWGGDIMVDDKGKYHMFTCRWREDNVVGIRSGHMTWGSSEVVHAIADNAMGPYKVNKVIGRGHNPEIYQSKDGTYYIGGLIGYIAYKSKSLYGPWEKIQGKYQWIKCPNNTGNRSYVVREDGMSIVMSQRSLFISEHANEDFIELINKTMYKAIPEVGAEDPVIWRDKVQYHCVYNGPKGRIAFYMRSKNGIDWKWMEGIAYVPQVVKHTDGTSEDWYKLERPKVIQDKYGRATHLHVAAMDTTKWGDLANDNHSSKNLILPLRVSRQIEILNKKRLTKKTKEITIKIIAEKGFNPVEDVDVKSLQFGAPEFINFGKGAVAINSKKTGKDLLVTFRGNNGFEDHNFAGKLIGKKISGEPIFGYAKMKPSAADYKDEIILHSILDEISESGEMKFGVYFKTKTERTLCADLIDLSTGKKVSTSIPQKVNGNDVAIVKFYQNGGKLLNLKHRYKFELYLAKENDIKTKVSQVTNKEVTVIPLNAGVDKIEWAVPPQYITEKGTTSLQIKYETRGKRDIQIVLLNTNPRHILRSFPGATVEGKGTATIDFSLLPEDKLKDKDQCGFIIFLTKPGGGAEERVTSYSHGKALVVE